MGWRQSPGPARALAAAVAAAVTAARAAQPEEFAAACARLGAFDPAQLRRVLGTVVRALLEDLHPDGLDGQDLQVVLERCTGAVRPWWPATDPALLAVLLVGALGVQSEQDELPPGDVAAHAIVLVADLLTARATGPGAPDGGPDGGLAGYLDRAFRDIAYAENDGP